MCLWGKRPPDYRLCSLVLEMTVQAWSVKGVKGARVSGRIFTRLFESTQSEKRSPNVVVHKRWKNWFFLQPSSNMWLCN